MTGLIEHWTDKRGIRHRRFTPASVTSLAAKWAPTTPWTRCHPDHAGDLTMECNVRDHPPTPQPTIISWPTTGAP